MLYLLAVLLSCRASSNGGGIGRRLVACILAGRSFSGSRRILVVMGDGAFRRCLEFSSSFEFSKQFDGAAVQEIRL